MIELQEARYKGVTFAVIAMPTTGGHRIIKYNYPGSDKQSIEVQGTSPRSFQMTAVIPFEDYYQERDDLIRVLEDKDEGLLTHPTFGDVAHVINGTYELDENISELGRATILIQFEVNDAVGVPVESDNAIPALEEAVELSAESIIDTIIAEFELTGIVANIEAAIEIGEGIIEQVNEVTDFVADVKLSVQSPALFANVFGGVFADIYDFYLDAEQSVNAVNRVFFPAGNDTHSNRSRASFDAYVGMFNYGDDALPINPTTHSRLQRKNNQELLINSTKTIALSYAYLSAAGIDHETDDDLGNTQEILETQYTDIRDNHTVSNASLEALDRARVIALTIFDNASVTTPKIFTINTPSQPLSVLLYAYYGHTRFFDTIAELNNITMNAFVEGDVKMVSV